MATTRSVNINNIANIQFSSQQKSRTELKQRPYNYRLNDKEHDKLRNTDIITKTKINIENFLNTPGYAYRGLKGDPDYNFFEQQKVSRIPYYVGGLGLAAVCLAGKSKNNLASQRGTKIVFKKILTGVIMYYIARELANLAINVPVKMLRGVDLNMPYRKITSLREGNPLNLPNNKKPSNQNVFESTEFTRWDLLYKYNSGKNINETFDKLAKKFGIKGKQNDSDSRLLPQLRKLMIMTTAWKYMLSVPFVITGLGLAQQEALSQANMKSLFHRTIDLFKPSTTNRWAAWRGSAKANIIDPICGSFKQLWKGTSLTSKILGRGAILASVATAILANAMILSKTSLKNSHSNGGRK